MGWVLHSQDPGPGFRPPHQLSRDKPGESAPLQATKVILRITTTSRSAGLKGLWGGGHLLHGPPPLLTSRAPYLSKDRCSDFSERDLQGSPLPRDRVYTPPPDSPRPPTPHCSSPEPVKLLSVPNNCGGPCLSSHRDSAFRPGLRHHLSPGSLPCESPDLRPQPPLPSSLGSPTTVRSHRVVTIGVCLPLQTVAYSRTGTTLSSSQCSWQLTWGILGTVST